MNFAAFTFLNVTVIADDPLVQAALSNLLEGEAISVLAGGISDGSGETDAEVLLWDADPELDAEMIGQQDLPVLALVYRDADAGLLLAAGVAGVLYRTATAAQLAAGLRAVAAGLRVFEPDLLQPLLTVAAERDTPFGDLTPREVDVLELVSEGLSNKRIAKQLGISVNTVKFHVNALFSKFGAKSRTELAVRGVQQGQTNL